MIETIYVTTNICYILVVTKNITNEIKDSMTQKEKRIYMIKELLSELPKYNNMEILEKGQKLLLPLIFPTNTFCIQLVQL